ncbi:MAG: DUF420 domain-containing protein [Acidobacteria bacterium]|nr:DUF420 domain-containing protein [Acidobacteriota bacterium]
MNVLPHLTALVNTFILVCLLVGRWQIAQGNRIGHPRWMRRGIVLGLIFIGLYGMQTVLLGHQRFPGNDWVRTLFLIILQTHTLLAMSVVPLVWRLVVLAKRNNWVRHRRLARWTFPIWLYVTVTGLVIYAMNHYVRPISPI